jgi:ribonuclease BN (tRNA processing enzyme)
VLLTHLHFDHILGLPFFGPLLMQGAELDVYGPRPESETLQTAVTSLFRPPFFPIELEQIGGRITFHELAPEDFTIGSVKVKARRAPHPGNTLGFRIEADGASMVYLPDHQAPRDLTDVADAILELCEGADLVVHDAQYTVEEFGTKWNWGHSTGDYAVRVAALAQARHLLLFHHDPARDDRGVAALERESRALTAARALMGVSAAREGTTLDIGPVVAPNRATRFGQIGVWKQKERAVTQRERDVRSRAGT